MCNTILLYKHVLILLIIYNPKQLALTIYYYLSDFND